MMNLRCRLLALALIGLVVVPLFFPTAGLVVHPNAWSIVGEADRIFNCCLTTLALVGGAILLSVPTGSLAAVVLERGRLPWANGLRGLVAVGLFLPLPVYAAGWQAAIGTAGVPDAGGWRRGE